MNWWLIWLVKFGGNKWWVLKL